MQPVRWRIPGTVALVGLAAESGFTDTADRFEEILAETGFGEPASHEVRTDEPR